MGGNNEKKIKQQRITKCFPRWNSNRYRHQRKDGKQHWEIPPLVGRGDMLTAEKRHSVDSWVGSDILQRRIAFKILPSLALPPPTPLQLSSKEDVALGASEFESKLHQAGNMRAPLKLFNK